MPDLLGLYNRLPITGQNLVCGLEAWRANRLRYGGSFRSELRDAEERNRWSHDEVVAFRDQRINAFVRHAAETVPWYARLFRDLELDPAEIKGLNDLTELPLLTKKQVQDHPEDFLSQAVPRRKLRIAHTSGTTGGGLRFARIPETIRAQWATWWRCRRWHGIRRGVWCANFGGRTIVPAGQRKPPYWRMARPLRQVFFSAHHMGPDTLTPYIDELRRRKPPWIGGYPSLIALLASHMLDRGIDLGYRVRWVTLGAENLLEQQVALIREAFGIKPTQVYGMAEAVANASECEEGRLHVDEDFAGVEFIPQPGTGAARIVGTNFTNPATPLIRYDTGDMAVLAPEGERCPCGRPGRIIERIDGRKEDYVVLSNGMRLGRMDQIFKDLVNIREAQILQSVPGAFTYRIVRSPRYGAGDETRLMHETRITVGDGAQVKIEYVDRLERSAAGKLRFVVSDIPEAKLD